MSGAQKEPGKFTLGDTPRVVGSVSQEGTLARLAARAERDCDIVEVRVDLIGPYAPHSPRAGAEPVWFKHAQAIEARGLPVVVTVRLATEGGKWKQPDELRLPLFEEAMRHLAAADIELRSPILEPVSAMAREHGRALIVSHHDFGRTPPLEELRVIVDKASRYGTVAKIATMIRNEDDLAILRALLAERRHTPLCVLGMGPMGPQTRIDFPKLGSCLTYGYLDTPIAPGQASARELMRQLHG
ncbi:MAG: type I 3-dehydroquinate dehydratase [Verrucomicrobiia bacterium]|jgi:3-dehydroquinate dehydratase-1